MEKGKIDRTTVKEVDLKRYMGNWYEIARFNHWFERGLEAVTAVYILKENGRIAVRNCGHKGGVSGKLKCTYGKAKLPDPAQPGKLKVTFFLFFYSDYYILELDENYQWALVGSSSVNYLWILSRTPHMPSQTLTGILQKARARGYDTNKLIFVTHA